MSNQDAHLADLVEFLKFPSVSTESAHVGDVRACGEWIVEKMRSIGLTAELHETPRHPVVVGRNEHKEGRPTVMIYGHYDVQPVDPIELWDSPPFEPRIEDGKIFARGATDNKGQILSHILGVGEAIDRLGEFPAVRDAAIARARKFTWRATAEGVLAAYREVAS